jgi:hypothetical protein
MQLKLINNCGKCRGHPPEGATNRDGPDFSWTVGQLDRLVICQPPTADCRPPTGMWNRGSPWDIVVKRRRRREYFAVNPALRVLNLRLKTQDSRLASVLARDWLPFTCSVKLLILQDRDKDRRHYLVLPAEKAGWEKYALGRRF